MTTAQRRPPVSPGDPAPDFVLPAVNHDGTVALVDYRGKSPVLLAIEGEKEGLAGLEKFPTDDEFLAAAQPLLG